MPKVNMTANWVSAIKVEKGREIYHDEKVTGLGIRVSFTGKKAWQVLYRMKGDPAKKVYDLGEYPAVSLADARERAQALLVGISRGIDPAQEKRELDEAPTFQELAREYIERHAKPRKATWRSDANIIAKDLDPAWKRRKAREIRRRDVLEVLDRVVDRGSPIQANRTLAVIRKVFNWGISRDIVESNPCAQVKAPSSENHRDRVLDNAEIKALWVAFGEIPKHMGDAFKVLLLTAQRKSEVLEMGWSELDLDGGWWTIPSERTKNGFAHRVPLSPQVLALLRPRVGEHPVWVFPSPKRKGKAISNPSNAVDKVRELSGVDFRLHDLRRTVASQIASLGYQRLVIGKLLNHVEQGVTKVYDRHSYDAEKRQALEAWSSKLAQILATKTE